MLDSELEKRLRKVIEFTDSFYKTLFEFPERWNHIEHPPKEEGYYLTLRFTRSKLYTYLDQWKNNEYGFQTRITDGSRIIGWREISEEDRKKMKELENYVKEYDRGKQEN